MKRPRPITVKIRRTRLPSGMTSRSPPLHSSQVEDDRADEGWLAHR
jgi:hypothetical protein